MEDTEESSRILNASSSSTQVASAPLPESVDMPSNIANPSQRDILTRRLSSNSSDSSTIFVQRRNRELGNDEDDHVSLSTPPTSLSGSTDHGEKDVDEPGDPRRRSERVKQMPRATYTAPPLRKSSAATKKSGRTVSGLTGRTLFNDGNDEDENTETTPKQSPPFGSKVEQALDMDWEIPTNSSPRTSPRGLQRKPSVKDKMKKAAKTVSTVLGKRSRDVVEAGKRTLEKLDPKQSKILKQLDIGKGGVLDEMDLDQDFAAPPSKRARLMKKQPLQELTQAITLPAPLSTTTNRMKKWQKEGLYVGQDANAVKTQKGSKKQSKAVDDTETTRKSFMPMPMFGYIDKQRDFVIPFDVFAPTLRKGDPKPKDWHQLNRNRLIGDAKDLWAKDDRHKESSYCFCQPGAPGTAGCDEDCLNRAMQYECNANNCRLDVDDCGNRAFAQLAKRTKKGGAFDTGVEILSCGNRGFGIRACRTFAPGQIIMEYTGEVITVNECERRMREVYKDKKCYYLMELERGLVIDGTRGSMARFINHSCAPNCEVRMVKVNDTLRMGVFAGEAGVATGEELSYDYNFDNFGSTHQPCYCGAESCRGYLGPRLNATEKKKQEKEEIEARKKAADDARRRAERDARRKQDKAQRGNGWRGWIAVDDPETKAKLRAEKAERMERDRNSSRALRLAARHSSIGVAKPSPKRSPIKVKSIKRRETTGNIISKSIRQVDRESAEGDEVTVSQAKPVSRSVSNASKFREELSSARKPSSSTFREQTGIDLQDEDVAQPTPCDDTTMLVESNDSVPAAKLSRHEALVDAASKTARGGKEVMKALKNGLKNASTGSTKLRQSTLSFHKLF